MRLLPSSGCGTFQCLCPASVFLGLKKKRFNLVLFFFFHMLVQLSAACSALLIILHLFQHLLFSLVCEGGIQMLKQR